VLAGRTSSQHVNLPVTQKAELAQRISADHLTCLVSPVNQVLRLTNISFGTTLCNSNVKCTTSVLVFLQSNRSIAIYGYVLFITTAYLCSCSFMYLCSLLVLYVLKFYSVACGYEDV